MGVSAALEDSLQEHGDGFVRWDTLDCRDFCSLSTKALYAVCVKVGHQKVLRRVRAWRWPEVFGAEFSSDGAWRSLYKPPIEKRTADLQWRLVHGAIATNRHVAHLNPATGRGCPFCGEEESVTHLFLQCKRLEGLLEWFRVCLGRLGHSFSLSLFISGPRYKVKKKQQVCLVNFLLGTAKLAIWLTRKRKMLGLESVDPLEGFRGMVKSRIRVEFAYYKLVNDVRTFSSIWCVGGLLCEVGGDGELLLTV